jgi:hypothetical protein
MPGNDGKARVAVPVTVLPTAGATGPATDETEGATVPVAEGATTATTVTGQPGLLSRLLSQAADARELADRRTEEVADLRERLGRAEGEALALRGRVEAEREARERAEAREAAERERAARLEAERERLRDELDFWTAGGPFERTWRALVFRRRR